MAVCKSFSSFHNRASDLAQFSPKLFRTLQAAFLPSVHSVHLAGTYRDVTMAASSSTAPSGLVAVHKVLQKKEKTPTLVFRLSSDANLYVATEIANLIRNTTKEHVVLGLATGSTPVGTKSRLLCFGLEKCILCGSMPCDGPSNHIFDGKYLF